MCHSVAASFSEKIYFGGRKEYEKDYTYTAYGRKPGAVYS